VFVNKTLLPSSASGLEKNIETSVSRNTNLPVPVNTLWDPETCPASVLPWLAWALSVDEWNSDWPESVKRAALLQSIAIHRHKGTVEAVRRVLNVIGINVDLREWYQTGGEPHTFSLTAWARDNRIVSGDTILTAELYRALQRAVDAVKPVRSHYDFIVGVQFDSDVGVIGTTASTLLVRRQAETESRAQLQVTTPVAVITQRAVAYVRVKMESPGI
jgi:phage tail P2-like protein